MPAYQLNTDNRFAEMLKSVADSNTMAPNANSEGEVIRRAVALYSFLHQQIDNQQGLRVAIIDKNSKVVTIIDPLP